MTPRARPTGRILLTVGLLSLATSITAIVLLGAWRSDLPDPVASHWSASGVADGFTSTSGVLWILLIAGLIGLGVTLTAAAAPTPAFARIVAGFGTGTQVFVQTLILVSTGAQRGAGDAAEVAFNGWWLLAGMAAGVIAGAAVAVVVPSWRIAPPVLSSGETATRAATLALKPDEQAVWSALVSSGRLGTVLSAVGVSVTVVLAVILRMWWLLGLSVFIALITATMLAIRVTVDPSGLRVRGRLGWPRASVPLERVTAVDVVEVNALRDFGGWGYRIAVTGRLKGARGFILHSGPAIAVTTVDGRIEVTVVEDAATGAALLEAYRQRAAGAAAGLA